MDGIILKLSLPKCQCGFHQISKGLPWCSLPLQQRNCAPYHEHNAPDDYAPEPGQSERWKLSISDGTAWLPAIFLSSSNGTGSVRRHSPDTFLFLEIEGFSCPPAIGIQQETIMPRNL